MGLLAGLAYQGVLDPILGPPCESSETASISTSDLPGFVSMGSSIVSSPGFILDRDATVVGAFRGGRTSGYLASVALEPPYRAESDAQASALGYPIGPWPLLPLEGSVVADTPGLLEVYVTVEAFRTTAAPTTLLQIVRGSGSGSEEPAETIVLPIAEPHYAYTAMMGPDDGLHQRVVSASIQDGSRFIQIAARGGRQTGSEDLTRLVSLQLDRLSTVCPG